MAPAHTKYRPDVDGIRGLAVLLVIAFHTFPKAVTGGFVGVDIFFVISGFLISTILLAEFGKPGARGLRVIADFYGRRVRRIFPALIVVLVACLLLGYYRLLPDQFKRLGLHAAASAGFCLNLVLARDTGYFDAESLSRPLLHLWSLGIEEQFYLGWPLFVWLAMMCRIRLLPIVVFIAGVSFFCGEYQIGGSAAAAFYLPQIRIWELTVGSITALIYPALGPQPAEGQTRARRPDGKVAGLLRAFTKHFRDFLAAVGMALVIVGLFQVTKGARIPNAWTLCPTVGTALLICAGEHAWINRWVLSQRALVWVGLISFPLYLWNWPLLCFSQISFVGGQSIPAKCAITGVSVLLAWLTYALVEKPLRFGARRTQKTVMLAVAMVAVGLLGAYAFNGNGFPSRFPPIVQELSNFSYKTDEYYRRGTYYIDRGQDETALRIDKDEISPKKPTIFLWGDSHAAQLYQGYKLRFSAKYNIVQRTAVLSPPLLDEKPDTLSGHRPFNDFVFESIRLERPECVVLAANWCLYDWVRVGKTITALKRMGIRHVVVVGPVPQWVGGLPQQIYIHFRKHPHEALPYRLKEGLSDEPGAIEPKMEKLCLELGAEYISSLKIFGTEDGFLIRFGETADSLTAYDYGHLTKAGSEYLVAHFPEP